MEQPITYQKISLENDLSGVISLMELFPEKNSEEEFQKVLTAEPFGPY